jgi:hypothetical protein
LTNSSEKGWKRNNSSIEMETKARRKRQNKMFYWKQLYLWATSKFVLKYGHTVKNGHQVKVSESEIF